MPIDSELNSALENQTYFYKEFGRGAGRSSRTEKNLQKRSLAPIAAKLESARTKLFLTGRCLGTVLLKQSSSNFNSDPLTFDLGQFPAKKAKIEQKVIKFFLERQEEIGPQFCDIWIAL